MMLPRLKPLTLFVTAASLFGLSGCNQNYDDGSVPPGGAVTLRTVTITPSLGRISNARIVLRNAARPTQVLGDRALNTTGTATFRIPSNVPSVVAELVAGPGTQYFDEGVPDNPATPAVNESMQPFPTGQTLRVAFNAGGSSQNIGMTALTEAAYRRALTLAGTGDLNAAWISQANAYIQSVFGVGNILQAPVIIGSPDDYRSLLNASAASRDYAMRLAALAEQARRNLPAGTGSPAIAMMNTLAEDLRDGQLNSSGDNVPYDFNAFLTAWRTALTQLRTRIIDAIGTGEGGLTQAQVDSLTSLFTQLSGRLQVNPNPTAGGVAVPLRTEGGIAEYACADESKLKSATGPTYDLDFVNNSGGSINIYWLNMIGSRVPYKTGLATGSTYHQNSTYVTHPWVVTNAAGQCKGIFVGVAAGNKTITFNADGSVNLGGTSTGGNTEPATVNALLGGNYTLTYHQSQAGGQYTDGQQVSFSVNAATGVLSVGGMPLGDPLYIKYGGVANTAEVIWKDGNVEYALSNNTTGVFNEINISDKSKAVPFMGQFRLPAVAQTCTSPTSGDNIVKFANAPADFCGFTRSVSHQIGSGGNSTYTFVSADADLRYLVVNLENNAVKSLYAENSKYAFGCGSGTQVSCSNIVYVDGVNAKEFIFNNTVLSPVSGAVENLTLVSGSVIHPVSTSGGGGDMTKTCVGNTNPRGCLTITGDGAMESAFEHIGSPLVFGGGPQVQLSGTPPASGAITFFGAGVNANSTNDGVSVGFQKVVGSTDNATYTFLKYDGSLNLVANYGYQCVKDAGNDCPGLSVDTVNRRIVFDGVVMEQKDNLNGGASTGKTATFNGELSY